MAVPVSNWSKKHRNVSTFHDLIDSNLLHYGPGATWGPLLKQNLGMQATIIRAEIDFAPSPQLLQELSAAFPGFRLTPLVAVDVENHITLDMEIGAPHIFKLSVIQSLPFPRLSLNATISHSDGQYSSIIQNIERGWANQSLLTGTMRFIYLARKVESAHGVVIASKDASHELRTMLGDARISPQRLAPKIHELVEAKKGQWLKSNAPSGYTNAFEDAALDFITDKITRTFFRPANPIVVFDSNDKVEAVELVPSSTLVPVQTWTLNKSSDARLEIETLK